MGDLVNLRQKRKQKARTDSAAAAAANRAAFGRSKLERQATDDANRREAHRLDGLKRERESGDGDAS